MRDNPDFNLSKQSRNIFAIHQFRTGIVHIQKLMVVLEVET